MKHLLLGIFVLLSTFAHSQEKKIEKEEDIKRNNMPENAQKYLQDNIPEKSRKIRFYYETDGDKESYEAKFKFRKNRYSVEFNERGILEDIEVVIKKENLDRALRKKIDAYLEMENDRYRIEKIQAQYIAGGNNTEELLPGGIKKELTPDNYELIVATKNAGKLKKFEMLFDAEANFKSEREILRNSYDYLIF
ncbi:hypothetical protein G3I01_06240 [Gramella sp. MT6]|uniref:hypothetical protein n=1 Tax=Gramella sp. MT6 TaxID=2705471 RepID=UPI001C5E86CD|nr:hypothetical protein [Gramella sp. MT6]QYA25127.1 hypothetical protein G3I01_06240 [Gramella sp. MT6]